MTPANAIRQCPRAEPSSPQAPPPAPRGGERGAVAAWGARDVFSGVVQRSGWAATTLLTVVTHHFVLARAKGGSGEGSGSSSSSSSSSSSGSSQSSSSGSSGAGGRPSGAGATSGSGSSSGSSASSRPSASSLASTSSKSNPSAFGRPAAVGGPSIVRGIPVAPYQPGVPYVSGTAFVPPRRGISLAAGGIAHPLPAGLLGLNAGILLEEDILLQPVGYFSDPWFYNGYFDPSQGEQSNAPNCTMGSVDANKVLVGGAPDFLDDDEFDMIIANATQSEQMALTNVRNDMLQGRLNLSQLPDEYLNATALRDYCTAPPSHGLSSGAEAGIAVGAALGTLGILGVVGYVCCRRRSRRRRTGRGVELTGRYA